MWISVQKISKCMFFCFCVVYRNSRQRKSYFKISNTGICQSSERIHTCVKPNRDMNFGFGWDFTKRMVLLATLTLPGWTISWWPLRLYWICISFWKLSWKTSNHHQRGDEKENHEEDLKLCMEWVLTPCFIISLAWLATSFTMLRAAARIGNKNKTLVFLSMDSTNDRPGRH